MMDQPVSCSSRAGAVLRRGWGLQKSERLSILLHSESRSISSMYDAELKYLRLTDEAADCGCYRQPGPVAA
ncbi:hypothetical protein HaLaN_17376 [Haematococcus lacustris]|uniref:Uncharacterized protein n=1 Tax=Haematococcus lacustris TaxID=44745 RepID=A0A699ZCG7_HAELA|nr:hypothetical protein HaLaN_17376 [Haematococcus lacustris]